MKHYDNMLLMLWKQLCFGWLCIVLQQQSVATSPGGISFFALHKLQSVRLTICIASRV